MEECCTCRQTPKSQRRINGLQLPLNVLQVLGWIVFLVTALLNFIILIEIQFHELKVVSIISFVILYICHVSSHVTAALIDPSERELRKLKVNNVPEFDRSVHAHVIENGRCHLCNIYTSSKNTKHCSLCNKCVDHFDHHCKWLNNCVGQRNYAAFITCVTTALLISLFTATLCLTDIVLFVVKPHQLSAAAQNYFNCSGTGEPDYKFCRNSINFLTFLVIFGVSALVIACALLHLCCFHVYITFLGVSTYEYIVKSARTKKSRPLNQTKRKCCFFNISKNQHAQSQPSTRSKTCEAENSEDSMEIKKETTSLKKYNSNESERNVTGLISMLIAVELDRAKKLFMYDKNKIHPQDQNNSSKS